MLWGNCLGCVAYAIDLLVMITLVVVLLCSFDLFAAFGCLCWVVCLCTKFTWTHFAEF